MFTIDLQCPELKPILAVIKQASKTGSHYSGVKLMSVQREETAYTNAEILQSLSDTGRDFQTPDSGCMRAMEQSAADELERRISNELKKAERAAKKAARASGKAAGFSGKMLTAYTAANTESVGSVGGGEKWDKQAQAAMLKAAMEAYMDFVSYGIETQQADGGVAKLTPKYAEQKRRKFGFEDPVGKATGQLIANLDVSISSPNIKLIRK